MIPVRNAALPLVVLFFMGIGAAVFAQEDATTTAQEESSQSVAEDDEVETEQTSRENSTSIQPESILRELQNDVLRVVIHARVIDQDQTIVWNMEMDELTVPGRGVIVRLNGENLAVEVEFTPYRQGEQTMMLVAQGQTWVKNEGDNKLRYQTSIKSIPVTTDEPVIFYPLGVDPENSENLNLELEIIISQYIIDNRPQGAGVTGNN